MQLLYKTFAIIFSILATFYSQQSIALSATASQPSINLDYAAHWLTTNTLLLPKHFADEQLFLSSNFKGKTTRKPLSLVKDQQSIAKPKHLQQWLAYHLAIDNAQAKLWLKSQLLISKQNSQGQYIGLSYLQTARLLDHLYTSGANDANEESALGASLMSTGVQFKLWAPTALSVDVLLFDQNKHPLSPAQLTMVENSKTGIWQVNSEQVNEGDFYQYQITLYHPASGNIERLRTTDPYSLSLSTNSQYSQVVDLSASSSKPQGWDHQKIPSVKAPEDNIFYETHINDFSASDSALSSESVRGKYAAFSEKHSHGIKHLQQLKAAGINTIHLLPSFDIGTVNEEENATISLTSSIEQLCAIAPSSNICAQPTKLNLTLKQLLASFDPLSEQAQALVSALKTFDDYNWGYDPYHYTVPEGSYAQNPDGISRIKEFRQMIQSLHNLGFRVVMDVVYNHTHQAGLQKTSVLDKIVPNYYQRLHPISGKIAQSTCCDNTATEHAMMEKLMIDSLIVWTRDYKIDGFRFDLMAHQPKQAMLKARQAVQAIDSDNYFYGEGWNFGEVANNKLFTQASQLELSGSEIGTFTDRLRDAVRGGAFSASGIDIRKSQGIGSGLATFNNEVIVPQQALDNYYLFADQLRIGLTGNLANFPLINAQNQQVTGKDIPYGDQPTGYALDPADTINYVSKHDNQTLWDNNQYRLPYSMSTHDRVRFHLLSLAFPILAQGIPFIHMGSELLRSKSFLRDSYDYSNWFNSVDFSAQTNNYHIGLPPAEKDQANWPLIREIIKHNQGRDQVTASDIAFSKQHFLELIAIRMSSPLFRLTKADDIIQRLSFHNTGSKQQIGLIAMLIDDENQAKVIDDNFAQIMVLFNSSSEEKTLIFNEASKFKLHPTLQNSVDQKVKQSTAINNEFTVPPLTTAVFIKKR